MRAPCRTCRRDSALTRRGLVWWHIGWAGPGNRSWRLAHHAAGTGANLLRHVAKAGISWELVRTWPGDRHLERRLKNRGGHARLCPTCRQVCA
jgi:hypothetical protein